MTPVSARVTAWVEEIAKAHAAATEVGLLTDEEHRARLEAEWAVLKRVPALLAIVRGVAELADTYAFLGATLHNVPAAESYTDAANDLRRLLADAAPDTEKETGE